MNSDDMPASEQPQGRAKGGKARAEAMSPEQRRAVARKAAKARWSAESAEPIPKATHMGVLRLGDTEIPCAVLEDGRRVLTQGGFLQAMGRNRKPKAGQGGTSVDVSLPFLAAKNLEPFVYRDFRVSTSPVVFEPLSGGKALGYAAELLPEVCRIISTANRAGALTKAQAHIAIKCELLLAGLENVGIVALVDEATGYQSERDRDALQAILAAYVSPEFLPWELRFPNSYYEEMFRLLGWTYSPPQLKKPKLIAKLTDELVYKHLPPGVREELKRKNPPDAKGNRKFKNHQFLTPEIGNRHLEKQVAVVTGLMKASAGNRRLFKQLFDNAFPKPGQQLSLGLSPDEDDDS